ncbi:uncharacterized protein DUF1214 [Novosphingobium sp. PhB165]|uniref:DUF1254 domain-containing protein n=1 Tax=Novosphingobium sp. PhB165 TaxID=2485105 RepID=UPI0010D06C62|nr:DUF1254 domain-containing protein [Novosphingobium sp. PhB165]TCM19370.1 uncharacterized protein DUF1214 [Novosphingobium sp. PhB165]
MQEVNLDNFIRAETDTYFAAFAKEGAFGKLSHSRELADINHQTVVRTNRDTIYSRGVYDLDAGPITITLPDANGRFMSVLLIDEDHYAPATFYDSGTYTVARDQVGARYLAVLVRIFVDPKDPTDLARVHALQDAIEVTQARPGQFEIPSWNQESLTATRAQVRKMTGFDTRKAFGARGHVDPTSHLIGTARGWGGNPERDAVYISGQPTANDGTTVHRLVVKDVPVNGFWSISVYNKDGYFTPNPQQAYSLNNVTATKDEDGTYAIQFGGWGGDVANCLPITPGWNYTVRLYRPREAILNGSWVFPAAQPI